MYRGFATICKPRELGAFFHDPNSLISFTTSKQTAYSFAESQKESESDYWGYVIRIDIPVESIYFHHLFDSIGAEHPKEKEVIILPYGHDYEVIEILKPVSEE